MFLYILLPLREDKANVLTLIGAVCVRMIPTVPAQALLLSSFLMTLDAILGLTDTEVSGYSLEVKKFVQWCDDHHYTVDTKKTEEMAFYAEHLGAHSPLLGHYACVTQVHSYKYSGGHIDCNLSWNVHVNSACARIQQ